MEPVEAPRRVLATRNAGWAKALARGLGQIGVRPNGVSIASVFFALASGVAYYFVPLTDDGMAAALFVVAAAGIQLRLLCNLLDGMLAIEGGFKGKTGAIYNDLPDRMADIFIFVGAGYSARLLPYGVDLGWCAAALAVMTAYVRLLGGSLGVTQWFIGPMAKQHRMFTLTVFSIAAAVEALLHRQPQSIRIALIVVVVGSIVTTWRRTTRIVAEVNAQ